MNALPATTLDAEEIAKFSAIAAEWWDETGKFAPLHRINPVRLEYIRHQAVRHFKRDDALIAPFAGLTALDIGCGGGLVAEPLARMGLRVTGVDGSEKNIKTASVHAHDSGTEIDYRTTTAESLAATEEKYDMVLALEVVEHVADLPLFLDSIAQLVKPGGLVIMSTLNRTLKAYGLAIIGAEYVLRWLPRGTHDWKKFLKPHELVQPLQQKGLEVMEIRGLVLNLLTREWEISAQDIAVNYLAVFKKQA